MREVLFLAHRIPFPPDRGDKIRSHHLLKGLAKAAKVHVGTFAENAADRAQEGALADCAESHCLITRETPLVLSGLHAAASGKPVSLTAFDDAALRKWVDQTLSQRNIDMIFVFSGQMGQYVPDDFAGRVIIDLCDVDSAKFADYAADAAWPKSWLYAREDRLLSAEEERLVRRADRTLLISDAEAELLGSRLPNLGNAALEALGNGIDADFFNPDSAAPHAQIAGSEGPHFVFTGQMDYPPNHAAAMWVIDHLMPDIRKRWSNATFHVVGRAPLDALLAKDSRKGGQEGVRIWGEVADVRPFLKSADIVLIPLSIARGVQNKVLEAMAMERCVLLSPEAATGIAAQDARDFQICDAETGPMIAALEKLMADPAAREKMGKAGRKFVQQSMSWDAIYARLDEMLGTALTQAEDASSNRHTPGRKETISHVS